MKNIQCDTCLVMKPASEFEGGCTCSQCSIERGTKLDVKKAVNSNRYDNTIDKINILPKGPAYASLDVMPGVMGDKWI